MVDGVSVTSTDSHEWCVCEAGKSDEGVLIIADRGEGTITVRMPGAVFSRVTMNPVVACKVAQVIVEAAAWLEGGD